MVITNRTNIPLALAVWAVDDNYDYHNDPKYFSATTLLKPTRQIILQKRVDTDTLATDVEDFLARSMGTAIHAGIEKAWLYHHERNLKLLGYPDTVISKFKINPDKVEPGDIPVYLEKRTIKEFNGYKIGGQFDFVADGLLHDNKSTTTMKWLTGSSDSDYIKQGSIYKWLNPDIITENYLRINFVFTDWSKLSAIKDANYPQHRACYKDYPLMDKSTTEAFLASKLSEIGKYMDTPEEELPECPDDELWRTPTVYKYFANPEAVKATKNFDNLLEANQYQQSKGKGVVRIFPGEARRCKYCSAASICSQYKRMTGG